MLSFNLGLLLVSLTGTVVVPEPFRRPGLIRWGASAAELERALAAESAKLVTREGDRPTLTGEVRIDCEIGGHVRLLVRKSTHLPRSAPPETRALAARDA